MTANPTNVDTGAMHRGAGQIRDSSGGLNNAETAVQGTISNLMATWTGTTALTFNTAMQPFYDECKSVIDSLNRLATDIDNAANIYEATHEDNTSRARNMATGIPTSAGLPGM